MLFLQLNTKKNIMKKRILSIFALTMVVTLFTGCKDKAKEASTTEAEKVVEVKVEADKYTADVDASTIEWKGFKPTGSHNGTIELENGAVTVADGKVVNGTFLINMGSLKESERNAKLEGHLKSADFFDVEKYPSAVFEITGIEAVEGKTMLSGNLALKDAKNNVTFPVSVAHDGNTLTLTSESFTIDRTKWNVQYGSKSIFDNLGDKFINDEIELKIMVKATKA